MCWSRPDRRDARESTHTDERCRETNSAARIEKLYRMGSVAVTVGFALEKAHVAFDSGSRSRI